MTTSDTPLPSKDEIQGTSECPVCGKDSPHQHAVDAIRWYGDHFPRFMLAVNKGEPKENYNWGGIYPDPVERDAPPRFRNEWYQSRWESYCWCVLIGLVPARPPFEAEPSFAPETSGCQSDQVAPERRLPSQLRVTAIFCRSKGETSCAAPCDEAADLIEKQLVHRLCNCFPGDGNPDVTAHEPNCPYRSAPKAAALPCSWPDGCRDRNRCVAAGACQNVLQCEGN